MQKEFEVIFRSFYAPVKTFIYKLVKSEDDAADLAQEVFSQLWVKPEVWQSNPDIDRYIYRMAKYMSLNYMRDRLRRADNSLMEADIDLVEKVQSDISTIDSIIRDEANLLLEMALDKMPPKRREIFSLSRFEGLSHKDIAQKLNVSVRTVESHIYAALTHLKEIFRPC